MDTLNPLAPRTALFLPASNPRAIEKARGLNVDMVILDLEDAVREEDKESAREAARNTAPFDGKLFAIRVNAADSKHHKADLKAVRKSAASHVVVPKVENPAKFVTALARAGKPGLAMIETPAGILNAPHIAGAKGWRVEVAGVIAGTNDLAVSLKLPSGAPRSNLSASLQLIILAARVTQVWALDGVFNALDDPDGLSRECAEGRAMGFDGKSLIHPNQVEIARAAFSATQGELDDARALIEAAGGGAERFRDRMIEQMHVDQAKALIERAAR